MRLILLSLLAALSLGASGCSSFLVGRWTAAGEPPENAKFFVKQIDFAKDGTYSASAKAGDQEIFPRGKYEFDGMTLSLKPGSRGERRYKALLKWGRELQVAADGETQVLVKK